MSAELSVNQAPVRSPNDMNALWIGVLFVEGEACKRIIEASPGRVCRLGLTPPGRCEVKLRRDAGAPAA